MSPDAANGNGQDRSEEPPETGDAQGFATAARRSMRADRELAATLDLAESSGPPPSAAYVDKLNRRPPLDRDRERSLVVAAQRGDRQARARLVQAFMPLIASVARVYRPSPTITHLELLQEGVVGLLRALERYDPDRGTPFWAYASWWVRQAMQQLVSELSYPTVLSDRALRHLARLKDAHGEAVAELGREPSRGELAERAGLGIEQVEDLVSVHNAPRSTEEAVTAADGVVGTFGELLADPLAEGEYEDALNAIEERELAGLLSTLSDRERAVLRARYGLDGEEQSLRQIADRLGLSAERVRQIEQRALGKLAAAAEVDGNGG